MSTKVGPDAKWRNTLANDATANMDQPLIKEVVEEFVDNIKHNYDVDLSQGLANYGLHKVIAYAMIAARADALGIDPEFLRFSRVKDLEHLGSEHISRIVAAASDGVQIQEQHRVEFDDEDEERDEL